MFSDPAISALGFQLELYRWEDHFQRMRDRRAANAADAEVSRLCALNDWLVGRINHAVQAHDRLLAQAQTEEAEWNRRFGQLEARIAQLEQQNAELRAAKEKAEAKVVEYAKAEVRRILGASA